MYKRQAEDILEKYILQNFDMRPKAIIQQLDLLRPVYRPTAAYGHFGRTEGGFTWEPGHYAFDLATRTRAPSPPRCERSWRARSAANRPLIDSG